MINIKLVTIIITILYIVIAIIRSEIIIRPMSYEKSRYDNFSKKMIQLARSTTSLREINWFPNAKTCINIWYLANPLANKFIFIFPGNHGNITYRFDLIRFWYINYSVIIFDYPGFGKSYASKAEIYVPEELFTYCLQVLNLQVKNAILMGENVGCFWVLKELIRLQEKNIYPRAAILHTPVYSERKYLSDQFSQSGLIYPSFLFTNGFSVEQLLPLLNGKTPIFIAHSEDDKTIPITDSERMVQLGRGIKLIKVKGKCNSLIVNHEYIYSLLTID